MAEGQEEREDWRAQQYRNRVQQSMLERSLLQREMMQQQASQQQAQNMRGPQYGVRPAAGAQRSMPAQQTQQTQVPRRPAANPSPADADPFGVIIPGISPENLTRLQELSKQENVRPDLTNFLDSDYGRGTLKVQTFAADGVFPIGNARVVVFKSAGGKNYLLYDKLTDSNGFVEDLILPAPRADEVQRQNIPSGSFSILVEHPNYLRALFPSITVYDGVESIKPVFLVPKGPGTREPAPVEFE